MSPVCDIDDLCLRDLMAFENSEMQLNLKTKYRC